MAESGQEFSGKNVDEAVAKGLAQLQLREDQVDIEVLSKGSRGIFGLGSEPARVRISPSAAQPKSTSPTHPTSVDEAASTTTPSSTPEASQAPSEPEIAQTSAEVSQAAGAYVAHAETDTSISDIDEDEKAEEKTVEGHEVSEEELTEMAVEMLGELVQHMGFEAEVVPNWREPDEDNDERYLRLNIQGDDVSPLIGRRGEALASVQYLLRLMVNQRLKQWKNIVVDVDDYKERRITQLTQLATRMAEQVSTSGRAVSLEPMPASERRIVHMALRDHPDVYTQSSGEGDHRKVHIVARS